MTRIRVAATAADSRANGPSERFVVWFQGCGKRCDGCSNLAFQPFRGGTNRVIAELAAEILALKDEIDGVTFSGGEPFDQPDALFELIRRIRAGSELTVFIFSGYSFDELERDYQLRNHPDRPDAILCGAYRKDVPPNYEMFQPSANQELHFLTKRLMPDDFRKLPLFETLLLPDGRVIRSGILRS